MKKFFISTLIVLSTGLTASAQTVVSNNYDSPITSANDESSSNSSSDDRSANGEDYTIDYNSNAKLAGIGAIIDINKSSYAGLYMSTSFGDYSSYSVTVPFGLKQRYVFNDIFLIQGKIGPYLGFGSHDVQKSDGTDRYGKPKYTKEEKNEFLYGANASVAFGFKLMNTKKGNSIFVTAGYYISAPEFKTDNMFKNGSWGLGITTIINN